VLMAVGVLMHRFSLTRAAAYERLHRQAAAERLTPGDQAARLLEAVERLAPPAVS
jgi:two-component system, response regulator PdtaR